MWVDIICSILSGCPLFEIKFYGQKKKKSDNNVPCILKNGRKALTNLANCRLSITLVLPKKTYP